jgi:hypothetical protein
MKPLLFLTCAGGQETLMFADAQKSSQSLLRIDQ